MGTSASKDLQQVIEKLYAELLLKLQKHKCAVDIFLHDYYKWLDKRNEVIAVLQNLAADIEKHHRNVNIASLSGSSASFLGGAACLAGLGLAPVTGGLSVVLSVGGLMGSTAGALTMSGAHVVEFGLKRKALKQAYNLINEDCQETLALTALIESCQRYEAEIFTFLQESQLSAIVHENRTVLSKIITHQGMKDRLVRVEDGTAILDDYLILISFLSSENLEVLKHLKETKSKIDYRVMEKTLRLGFSLKSSVVNVRKCAVMLKNWRAGVTSFRAVSKIARFAKGAMLGLSLAADLYDIGSTAKEMMTEKKTPDENSIRQIVSELQRQKNEITEFYVYLSNLKVGDSS